jgi:prevent-host-death family protein
MTVCQYGLCEFVYPVQFLPSEMPAQPVQLNVYSVKCGAYSAGIYPVSCDFSLTAKFLEIIMTIIQHKEVAMVESQTILPVTKVKRKLLEILKTMEEDYTTVTVTRNGEPVGIMMTPDRYEALLETIEILGDNNILKVLKASQKDFKSGRVYTHDQVWKD